MPLRGAAAFQNPLLCNTSGTCARSAPLLIRHLMVYVTHIITMSVLSINICHGSLGLLLGAEAPVMAPNGVDFSFLSFLCRGYHYMTTHCPFLSCFDMDSMLACLQKQSNLYLNPQADTRMMPDSDSLVVKPSKSHAGPQPLGRYPYAATQSGFETHTKQIEHLARCRLWTTYTTTRWSMAI